MWQGCCWIRLWDELRWFMSVLMILTGKNYVNNTRICTQSNKILEFLCPYLLKSGTSQNETSQNRTKPAETTPKKIPKRPETTQNLRNLEFSASFHFSNFEPKCSNLSILGQDVSNF